MKPILKFTACILLIGGIFISSCQKKYLCPNCNTNQPPIANAGVDEKIVLPKDSVLLDGSSSSDPDGKIVSYKWIKISGPVSFNIIKTDSTKTLVKSLVMGVYKFELTVTDNGGLSAKDTVQIIVDDPKINQPPIANAGPDQTITLPVNSVLLNGSQSFDPDGNIVLYQWAKISGPTSFVIYNPQAIQTTIKNLNQGAYQFELTVTDNGGLSVKDTMQITVTTLNMPNDNTALGCNASMSVIGHLPTAGPVLYSVSSGTKILFIRGSAVDIYDTVTHGWETVSGMYAAFHNLPEQVGYKAAKVGSKIIFSAVADPMNLSQGQLVNIYDAASNSWSTTHLSRARDFYAMAVVGNKVFYAGGNNDSKKMDIYDASSNSWSVADFNEARSIGMAAISFENKIYFAGGYIVRSDSLVLECDDYGNNCVSVPALVASDRVDILDVNNNTWSVAHLSEGRGLMSTAILGNKVVFAGGEKPLIRNSISSNSYSTVVDFYNTTNNSWSAYDLGSGNTIIGDYNIYTLNTKLLIPHGGYSDKIHIYDDISNSWSIVQMPFPYEGDMLERGKIAPVGNKLLFFNQYFNQPNHKYGGIDIYNASSNTWCHTQLNFDLTRAGLVRAGNMVYIAGGITMSGCCIYNNPIDTVWHFNF